MESQAVPHIPQQVADNQSEIFQVEEWLPVELNRPVRNIIEPLLCLGAGEAAEVLLPLTDIMVSLARPSELVARHAERHILNLCLWLADRVVLWQQLRWERQGTPKPVCTAGLLAGAVCDVSQVAAMSAVANLFGLCSIQPRDYQWVSDPNSTEGAKAVASCFGPHLWIERTIPLNKFGLWSPSNLCSINPHLPCPAICFQLCGKDCLRLINKTWSPAGQQPKANGVRLFKLPNYLMGA